jgi:hypothetical protein
MASEKIVKIQAMGLQRGIDIERERERERECSENYEKECEREGESTVKR